jgi:protein SCO1/2
LPLKDFELVDQDGRSFKFSQLRGQTALVFFGFTNCPSVCPTAMQLLRQVGRSLQQQDVVVDVVFISVDGERDTPSVIKQFLEPFMPGFIGLTGEPRRVKDIATAFSAVFFKGMPTDTVGGYNVEHTSQVYLVDRDGRMRATFFNAPAVDVEAVTARVVREAAKQ